MKKILLSFILLLLSCAQMPADYESNLSDLQKIWETKDVEEAYKRIKGLKLTKEDHNYQTLGIPRESGFSPLKIYINKNTKKISSMLLPVYGKGEASFIKSQIIATDWKTFEHPVNDHSLRTEVSEYSESRGVSFLYDKLDPKKEVHVIYWGSNPKQINW